jgi:hypothetical protein
MNFFFLQALQRKMAPQFVSETQSIKNQFSRIQRIFIECEWIFSISYSTLLTITYRLRRNHAPPVGNCLTRKPFFWNSSVVNYSISAQQNRSKAINLCWTPRQTLEASIAADGQLLIYLFQYSNTSDLCVASYTLRPVFKPSIRTAQWTSAVSITQSSQCCIGYVFPFSSRGTRGRYVSKSRCVTCNEYVLKGQSEKL